MARRKRRRRRRRSPRTVVRYRTRAPARRSRSRRSARRNNPNVHTLKGKAQVAAAGAAYGYARKNTEFGQKLDELNVESIGRLATHGLLFHFIAANTRGKISSWLDAASTATLGAAGINFGYSNFNLEEAAQLEGGDSDMIGAVLVDEDDLPGAN